MARQCRFCGRYFIPDYRVKERQKACPRPECRKARKRAAHVAWVRKNPEYFADLYEAYVKPWREKRRMIKDKIPPAKPLLRLILLIPGDKDRMIQDKILLRRQSRRTFMADG